ncbi:(E)-4-hydroxy-3-methylbut-2-enyl diphosphate synthase [Artemisia annua]|uniref:(E)-4-hydroxy-3-methylbut-2-enyl diphosphate synthase n=1 Tax=Artemisia annua TaxID=35608 RepID=A0A2U1K9V1_ARTAN|nr:(E)-4-hydroxy-3-methylbut-2-enyl diphosphate synthase [Artemisia annua]
MRIGTNHGSLSDRIMSYYGDSPRGMFVSAFEFARICRKLDFHNSVFSMKASNPVIMVQAYHLLAAEMNVQGWDYPLHLGVTEAGEGEDGRMKSAIGIGTLLQDGLGDTIRVSLTEPPEEEIDPCKKLAILAPFEEKHRRYFDFQRRTGDLPVQKEGEEVDYRGVFHRDGSIIMSFTLDQLKELAGQPVQGLYFAACALAPWSLYRCYRFLGSNFHVQFVGNGLEKVTSILCKREKAVGSESLFDADIATSLVGCYKLRQSSLH